MASLNMVQLIGYLGRDVELRYGQSGNAVANLSLATDESYTDRDGNRVDKTEWHRIVAYGKQADLCSNFLRKGSMAYIQGSLQTRKWQDNNGVERYTTEIKALRIQFLDRKDNGQATKSNNVMQDNNTREQNHQPQQPYGYDDSDLPF